jgi:DNA-binding NtrC family response regulator
MAHEMKRILIVDHELEMAMTIADELGDLGYRALGLASGRQAIYRLRSEHFDAVVADLRMPDVDGLAVLHESRALDASRPVIMVTDHGGIQAAMVATRHGAYDYITKPFSLASLVHLLEDALGLSQ